MVFNVEWSEPIGLSRSRAGRGIYDCELDDVPAKAGVYVFGRKFGNNPSILYVGKALSLRSRINQQLNNARLMRQLEQEPNGGRFVQYGLFVARPGQNAAASISLIERAAIRHFRIQGFDLVNVQGNRPRTHEIMSTGKRLVVPKKMLLERT